MKTTKHVLWVLVQVPGTSQSQTVSFVRNLVTSFTWQSSVRVDSFMINRFLGQCESLGMCRLLLVFSIAGGIGVCSVHGPGGVCNLGCGIPRSLAPSSTTTSAV
uniref:Uncharacterized protein n=1 Tax=Cacopsylla melanoneura TaxID=428564 RepID=A0A8D9BR94_9HEMI